MCESHYVEVMASLEAVADFFNNRTLSVGRSLVRALSIPQSCGLIVWLYDVSDGVDVVLGCRSAHRAEIQVMEELDGRVSLSFRRGWFTVRLFKKTVSVLVEAMAEVGLQEVSRERGPYAGTIEKVAAVLLTLEYDESAAISTSCDLEGIAEATFRRWRDDPRTLRELERMRLDFVSVLRSGRQFR